MKSLIWVMAILIMVFTLSFSIYYYHALPDTMPIHFNAAGTPDGFASKKAGAFLGISCHNHGLPPGRNICNSKVKYLGFTAQPSPPNLKPKAITRVTLKSSILGNKLKLLLRGRLLLV